MNTGDDTGDDNPMKMMNMMMSSFMGGSQNTNIADMLSNLSRKQSQTNSTQREPSTTEQHTSASEPVDLISDRTNEAILTVD